MKEFIDCRCCRSLAFSDTAPKRSDPSKTLSLANIEGSVDVGNASSALVHDAMKFIEQTSELAGPCVTYPISRLQARFKLGYAKGCELAKHLEQIGFWTIVLNEDQVRCANLQPDFVTRPTDNSTGPH